MFPPLFDHLLGSAAPSAPALLRLWSSHSSLDPGQSSGLCQCNPHAGWGSLSHQQNGADLTKKLHQFVAYHHQGLEQVAHQWNHQDLPQITGQDQVQGQIYRLSCSWMYFLTYIKTFFLSKYNIHLQNNLILFFLECVNITKESVHYGP